MIEENFKKFHNEQVVQIGIHQTDWTIRFKTHLHKMSITEKFAK